MFLMVKMSHFILLDFAKAFDKVPHKRLLHKLCHYGVRGKTLQWITSFLSSRTQQVLVEGCESAKLGVLFGVPSLRAKPVLTVCQNVMMVKMSHCRWMDNMFKYFAYYWCKWNRTIVGCNIPISLFKQRGDEGFFPVGWNCTRVQWCLENANNDRS
jgi:hypothetical protein